MSDSDGYLVQFQLNKELRECDLEILTMFLENSGRSGGGEIVGGESRIDIGNKRLLNVYFKEKSVQERLLSRGKLKFQVFELIPLEPISKEKCEVDLTRLVLSNFKLNSDRLAVELYVEHLVQDLSIKSLTKSRLYSNDQYETYLIEFESAFDFNLLLERQKRKSDLNGRKINAYKAYKTNALIGRFDVDDSDDSIDIELIDCYFTNAKQSGIDQFKSLIEFNKKYFLLQLDNVNLVRSVMSKGEHKIANKKLILEEYICFELELI